MSEQFLSVRDLASRLGVSRRTVLRWIKAGRIPHIRAGRRLVRLCLPDVVAALRGEALHPEAPTGSPPRGAVR